MTLDPLIHAPFAVQAHVATVVPACQLGVWLLAFSHRGSRWHRRLGVAYFTLLGDHGPHEGTHFPIINLGA